MHDPDSRPRVAHVITRMIRGGAQENTMILVYGLRDTSRFESVLVTGPTYGNEGSVLPEAATHGVEPVVVPLLLRHINPLLDPLAFVHLWWVLARGRFDVVHTHSSKAGIIGRLAARAAGCGAVVHTVHGWPFSSARSGVVRRLYVQLERWCARLCDALVVVTTRDQDVGEAEAIGARSQYHLIRSGVDVSGFAAPTTPAETMRERWSIPDGSSVVGSVMRLSEQKAPVDWVRTAARVAEAAPNVTFVVVGDGPLRGAAEAEAERLGLSSRIRWVGVREDVPDFLGIFDVFLLTSLWEGLPRVIPQAMAAGVPVVATAVDGNVEAVADGVTGTLRPAKDIDGLAAAVVDLLASPERRDRYASAARERVGEFDQTHMIDGTADLYDRLLRRGRS